MFYANLKMLSLGCRCMCVICVFKCLCKNPSIYLGMYFEKTVEFLTTNFLFYNLKFDLFDAYEICDRFVASARQLAKALEVPLVNDLGYTKRYVRCLQVDCFAFTENSIPFGYSC